MSFAAMLTQSIKVQAYSGRNNFGEPQYSASTSTLKARVESSMEVIRDKNGEERVSETQVVTGIPVGLYDRVWLPGTDDSRNEESLTPMNVKTAQTPNGSLVMYHIYF